MRPSGVAKKSSALIGTAGNEYRAWIPGSTDAIHREDGEVLAMHAGGVSTPAIAERIMAAGADGTGSTSGVIFADNPSAAARAFISATRTGWDRASRP